MELKDRIAELSAPAAEAAGLVVDGVSVSPAGKRTRVTVTVDLPEDQVGSADLDAVAAASRAIGAALDEANVPSTPYVLEIGTPGTDRPLTERRHYLRARTRKVTVALVDGGEVTGRLTEVDQDSLVLDVDGEEKRIDLSGAERGRVEVELRRMEED